MRNLLASLGMDSLFPKRCPTVDTARSRTLSMAPEGRETTEDAQLRAAPTTKRRLSVQFIVPAPSQAELSNALYSIVKRSKEESITQSSVHIFNLAPEESPLASCISAHIFQIQKKRAKTS